MPRREWDESRRLGLGLGLGLGVAGLEQLGGSRDGDKKDVVVVVVVVVLEVGVATVAVVLCRVVSCCVGLEGGLRDRGGRVGLGV